jgi:hypothetical protein
MNPNFMNQIPNHGRGGRQHMEITPEMMMQPPICIPFNLNHLPIANITRIMKGSLKGNVSDLYTAKIDPNLGESS